MAETLAEQLATLTRERDRLEQFLMLDANWRALRQLDERESAGQQLQRRVESTAWTDPSSCGR